MKEESYLDRYREEIFKKYTNEELIKDIKNYQNGKGRLNKVLNHFFEEIIFECKSSRGKYSPLDVLRDNQLVEEAFKYIDSKPNFYNGSEITNIKSYFRNSGKLARKVSNFCPRNARDIYNKYNSDKKTILDTSCGFGSRMSGALLNGHNYIGFDPNIKLYDKLKEYYKFLTDNKLTENYAKLYSCGSEIFIEELVESVDLSFTSPPYFKLEQYSSDDGQSIIKFNDYKSWLNGFVKPTIDNTYKYLKKNGLAMINIKNLTRSKGDPQLFDDWFDLFDNHSGFEFVEVFEINHQSEKRYYDNSTYDKSLFHGFKEPVMVFRKIY